MARAPKAAIDDAVREFRRLTMGPWRLRRQIFSSRREFRRIERRCARAARDPAFELGRWESHQPVLVELLRHLERPRVLELGVGYASTPVVLALSASSLSLDVAPEWLERFRRFATPEHRFALVTSFTDEDWECAALGDEWDLAFIDNSPAWSRQSNLVKLAHGARFIVCHDTEECFVPAGSSYGWDFSGFVHVWTYDRFASYTTVASNAEAIPVARLGGIEGQPPHRAKPRPARV